MKSRLMAAMAAIAMLGSLFAPYAEAKSSGGRSSGGSRSSSGGSKSSGSWGSKSSTPKSSSGGWGSKSNSSPSKANSANNDTSKKGWGSTSNKGYTKPESKIEKQRYKDAVKSGKSFTTKESATADFKTKYGSQYSSKFSSEPSKRPDYIPTRYRHGDRDYDISYNPSFGGYGYWSGGGPGLGTFLLYDALSDAAMTATLMNNRGYYVGPPPARGFPWGGFIVTMVIVGGAIVLVVWFANRSSSRY